MQLARSFLVCAMLWRWEAEDRTLPAPLGPSTSTRCPFLITRSTLCSSGAGAGVDGSAEEAEEEGGGGLPQPTDAPSSLSTSVKHGGARGSLSATCAPWMHPAHTNRCSAPKQAHEQARKSSSRAGTSADDPRAPFWRRLRPRRTPPRAPRPSRSGAWRPAWPCSAPQTPWSPWRQTAPPTPPACTQGGGTRAKR